MGGGGGSCITGLLRHGHSRAMVVILASHLSRTMVRLVSRVPTIADTFTLIIDDLEPHISRTFYGGMDSGKGIESQRRNLRVYEYNQRTSIFVESIPHSCLIEDNQIVTLGVHY